MDGKKFAYKLLIHFVSVYIHITPDGLTRERKDEKKQLHVMRSMNFGESNCDIFVQVKRSTDLHQRNIYCSWLQNSVHDFY